MNFIILQIKNKNVGTERRKIKQKSQNHSIFIVTVSAVCCHHSLANTVAVPLRRLFRKEIFNITMFRPIMNVGGDHGTPPNVPE